jgi:hypothetical protein
MSQIGRILDPLQVKLSPNRRSKWANEYNCNGYVILATNYVEVGEDNEHEIVVWFYETCPGGDVLLRNCDTNMASISISMRWVCRASEDSRMAPSILILTIKYKIINF